MIKGNFWPAVPCLRLLLPLVTGIFTGRYIEISISYLKIFTLLAFITWILVEIASRKYIFFSRVARLLPFSAVFFLSVFLLKAHDLRKDLSWFGSLYQQGDFIQARLVEDPQPKTSTDKCEVSITGLLKGKALIPVKGKAILYFPKNSDLRWGDVVLINKKPDSVSHSNNPGEFNYARWLALKNIFHSGFLRKGEFIRVNNDCNWFEDLISCSRLYILNSIRKYTDGGAEVSGLAEALVIGYRGDLDKELLQKYSITGVVHIIAVSGLHLGLIYMVFNAILRFFFRRRGVAIQAFIIIIFLWFFSILTGGSASVLRSALMFSILIAGKTWLGQASVFNTLAASAILLLLYDPYLLWDVGFQLSYLAVIGIVWLQPIIFRSIFPNGLLLRKLWEMSSVTLAAQITTLPVCLYYFHQFPLFFLFSNLLVVPLSTLILFAGITLVSITWWTEAAKVMGCIQGKLIALMNLIVKWFASIPSSTLEDLYINEVSAFALMGLIAGSAMSVIYKMKSGLWLALCSILIISISSATRHYNISRQGMLLVYKTPVSNAEIMIGRKSLLVADSMMKPSATVAAGKLRGIKHTSLSRSLQFSISNRHIVIANDSIIRNYRPMAQISVLVITADVIPSAEALIAWKPGIVVLDGSVRMWKIAKWKTLCDQLLLRCHSVPTQGAFIYTFDDG